MFTIEILTCSNFSDVFRIGCDLSRFQGAVIAAGDANDTIRGSFPSWKRTGNMNGDGVADYGATLVALSDIFFLCGILPEVPAHFFIKQ